MCNYCFWSSLPSLMWSYVDLIYLQRILAIGNLSNICGLYLFGAQMFSVYAILGLQNVILTIAIFQDT